jgi:DNA repair protein RecO (recombination protein O)
MELTGGALDAIEAADEKTCSRALIRFLWNWAAFLGLRPAINSCTACARETPPGGALWYDTREGCLLCPECFHGKAGNRPEGENSPESSGSRSRQGFPVGPGARLWLLAVQDADDDALSRYNPDTTSLSQAKALATGVLTAALGKRLQSWEF